MKMSRIQCNKTDLPGMAIGVLSRRLRRMVNQEGRTQQEYKKQPHSTPGSVDCLVCADFVMNTSWNVLHREQLQRRPSSLREFAFGCSDLLHLRRTKLTQTGQSTVRPPQT